MRGDADSSKDALRAARLSQGLPSPCWPWSQQWEQPGEGRYGGDRGSRMLTVPGQSCHPSLLPKPLLCLARGISTSWPRSLARAGLLPVELDLQPPLGIFNYSSLSLQLSCLPFGIVSLCQFLKDPAGCFYGCCIKVPLTLQ